MDTDNKEQAPIIVEDVMSKHLEKKSLDPDWEYFGIKKKDVSTEISKGLTHWIHSDAIPVDMIGRLKKQIDMIKAMINAEFKTNRITIQLKDDDGDLDNPT
jgi:hypothetical protein|tara:strand:- start:25 stop:327 length:303 start_codon:yes stop_codon:yes gene_type:complete